MPLVKGKKGRTKEGISKNIKIEREAGKPEDQAIAIAMDIAGRGKNSGKNKGRGKK